MPKHFFFLQEKAFFFRFFEQLVFFCQSQTVVALGFFFSPTRLLYLFLLTSVAAVIAIEVKVAVELLTLCSPFAQKTVI